MRKILPFFITVLSAVILSCSVVFTGSITGTLADEEEYENGNEFYGISDAEVYLYTDIEERDIDFDAWTADENVYPDNPADGEPKYFLKTITDEQGNYTFNGLIWNELFPDYGKSGDRKEIYLLFYHSEYGMCKTPYPVYVISDVTNRIPVFKLSRIYNSAEISGSVVDTETGEPLQNVNVRIWVPVSWIYDSSGNIDTDESKFQWNDEADYIVLTDALGEWNQQISYRMLPSVSNNKETVIVRLTFAAGSYIAENDADADITDGGWDIDGNGTVDSDENEGFFQSDEIEADTYAELGEISLADELNTATVSGTVLNSSTNEGEMNVSVRIWVAEDWSYISDDSESIEAPDSEFVIWPENPSYTVTTNASGEYSSSINFERKPSSSDNRKTTRVRLVFIKDKFLTGSTIDSKLTDGGWDRDGNSTIDDDEDDAYYDPQSVVKADLENNLGSMVIKQTEFNETLSGEIWNTGRTELVNGVEVWLFYDPVDDDADPLTPMETGQPLAADSPDFTETTESMFVTQDTIEKGHFSFGGLEWKDSGYSGNQSRVSFYIYIPTTAERAARTLSSDLSDIDDKYYLTAGAANYLSLEQ